MKRWIRFAVITVVTMLGVAVLAQQQPKPDQVPLGDIARQQKAAKKAKRVITDDDLPARAPETAPAAAEGNGATAAEAQAAGKETAEAQTATPPPSDEQARQKKIAELKDSEEAEKRIIAKMEASLADPNLPDNRRRMYQETLSSARQLLEKFQNERQELEKQAAAAKPPAKPK